MSSLYPVLEYNFWWESWSIRAQSEIYGWWKPPRGISEGLDSRVWDQFVCLKYFCVLLLAGLSAHLRNQRRKIRAGMVNFRPKKSKPTILFKILGVSHICNFIGFESHMKVLFYFEVWLQKFRSRDSHHIILTQDQPDRSERELKYWNSENRVLANHAPPRLQESSININGEHLLLLIDICQAYPELSVYGFPSN
jgi:hypothetical protein